MTKLTSLDNLLEHDLKDAYDAEKRLVRALPKMAAAAESKELRGAIEEHLAVTKKHVQRLEQIFATLGLKPAGKTCMGMKGLIEEGEETLEAEGEAPFTDLAIIGAARRVEHYEMAAYLSMQAIAQQIGNSEVESLIQENLQEEQEADEKLSMLAATLAEGSEDEGVEDSDEDEAMNMEDKPVSMPVGRSTGRAATASRKSK